MHLYGALRRVAAARDPRGDSVVELATTNGETIADLVRRLGIREEELSPNLFLNGQYSALSRAVKATDRLALFPKDMGLLYSWYFAKAEGPPQSGRD